MPTQPVSYELLESRRLLASPAAPILLKDIFPGPESSMHEIWRGTPSDIAQVNRTLFFTADDGKLGMALWKTNGTPRGTARVKTFSNRLIPRDLTNANGTLYFMLGDAQLWRSDGTPRGTKRVQQFGPDQYGSTGHLLVPFKQKLLFTQDDGTGLHNALWITDGTSAGTLRLTSNTPGIDEVDVQELTVIGDSAFFTTNTDTQPPGLWKTTGTPQGTIKLIDFLDDPFYNAPNQLVSLGSTLYFAATNTTGFEALWKSDGTTAGTVPVKDLFPHNDSSSIWDIVPFSDKLILKANDGIHNGTAVWISDGTSVGTVPFTPTTNGRRITIDKVLPIGNTLYFSGKAGKLLGLWKAQNAKLPPTLVKNLSKLPKGSRLTDLTNVNGALYFSTAYETSADVLYTGDIWKSNGTSRGTTIVADFVGGHRYRPFNFTPFQNHLFVMADNGKTGTELWRI